MLKMAKDWKIMESSGHPVEDASFCFLSAPLPVPKKFGWIQTSDQSYKALYDRNLRL